MSRASSRALFVVVAIAVSFAVRDVATQANQVITISLPTAVMFAVTNVNAATPGNPSSTRIQFTDGILKNKRYVSIQVRASSRFPARAAWRAFCRMTEAASGPWTSTMSAAISSVVRLASK